MLFSKSSPPLLSLSSAACMSTQYIQYLWGLVLHLVNLVDYEWASRSTLNLCLPDTPEIQYSRNRAQALQTFLGGVSLLFFPVDNYRKETCISLVELSLLFVCFGSVIHFSSLTGLLRETRKFWCSIQLT